MARTKLDIRQFDDDFTAAMTTKLGLNGYLKKVEVPVSQSFTYDTAGIYEFVVPDNVYHIVVWYLIGAGGGGGGATSGSKLGGNGGMGQIIYNRILPVTPGQVLSITIGAPGIGGTAGKNGTSGGASSIGTLITASGGSLGPFWNANTGLPGADGGLNESPYIKTAFKNGLYGLGRTGSSGAGTAGSPGFCSIQW